MMELVRYTSILNESSYEYEDRKSVFIGMAKPVEKENDAIDFINSVKKMYPDARHHVYAYILRENSTMRFSDDGEPQGTAGRPVLDVIRKKGCTDIVVVVTRYFGGTLLGAGGLVRAYTDAAAGAINNAGVITYDIFRNFTIALSYPDYGKITPLLAKHEVIHTVDFSDNVKISCTLEKERTDEFLKLVENETAARAKCEILGEKFDFR